MEITPKTPSPSCPRTQPCIPVPAKLKTIVTATKKTLDSLAGVCWRHRTNSEDKIAMRVVIVARRERPIRRPGQVEKVLDKFKIGSASHVGPGPIGWKSTFDWSQNDDGSRIQLEIVLDDDAQAPSVISELRACGFVASSGNFALTH